MTAATEDLRTAPGRRSRIALRLALTVWLIYTLHFASNVVRETYLAVTLGERFSVRVDEYMGLHPDLFEIPGRGAYINSNPGASMLGAIPFALASPAIDALLRAKPELARPKPPASYDDPRPNRTRFMNEARRRGVDVKLALAAAAVHAGLMVPLGVAGALVMFGFLRSRLGNERRALWLALLYAFGTPIFFRSAFLNQNAIIAHATLAAYVLLVGSSPRPLSSASRTALIGAGALLGIGILCDYSGIAIGAAFGLWIAWQAWREAGVRGLMRALGLVAAGGVVPVALLLVYQWVAFGDPLLPAQAYMPPTAYSVRGWNGLTPPAPALIAANLFDPAYGLFLFCPMLAVAIAAPLLKHRELLGGPSTAELSLILGASTALLLFASSIQFSALQFNTGVRYLVPAVPLLFIGLVPVLLRLPAWGRALLAVPTLVVSWSVAMTREGVPDALGIVFTSGPALPWLTVLRKTAGAYAPFLAGNSSPLPIFLLLALALWLLWRPVRLRPAREVSPAHRD